MVEREIRQGTDLKPRLSRKIYKEGYFNCALNISKRGRPRKWDAKDFALNAYGIHHLHIPPVSNQKLLTSSELLFISFDRYSAKMIYLGDHESFDDGTLQSAYSNELAAVGAVVEGLTSSRDICNVEAVKLARHGFAAINVVDGAVVPTSMLATSGHGIVAALTSNRICREIRKIDPRLDDRSSAAEIFAPHADRLPTMPVFEWHLKFLDLILIETVSRTEMTVMLGH